jgi:predicted small lipoprotein YifL
MRWAAALTLLLTLTACGRVGELEPVEGTSLPPAPYGASQPLTAAELLVSDPVAVPERSVELRSESEEREDDPFDLPPEG